MRPSPDGSPDDLHGDADAPRPCLYRSRDNCLPWFDTFAALLAHLRAVHPGRCPTSAGSAPPRRPPWPDAEVGVELRELAEDHLDLLCERLAADAAAAVERGVLLT